MDKTNKQFNVPIFGARCVCVFCVACSNQNDASTCLDPRSKYPIGYTNLNPTKYPLICYLGRYYHFDGTAYRYIEYVLLQDYEIKLYNE